MHSRCSPPPAQAKARVESGAPEISSDELPAWVFASDLSDPHLSKTSESANSHLTVQEVAAQLRVSERTVRRLISRGQLQVVRIGRSVRITPAALVAMIEACSALIFSTLDDSRD